MEKCYHSTDNDPYGRSCLHWWSSRGEGVGVGIGWAGGGGGGTHYTYRVNSWHDDALRITDPLCADVINLMQIFLTKGQLFQSLIYSFLVTWNEFSRYPNFVDEHSTRNDPLVSMLSFLASLYSLILFHLVFCASHNNYRFHAFCD